MTADQQKTVSKADLAAYHDELMQNEIIPLMGPTYDANEESINFPVTARATYDQERESIDFS